MGQFYFFIDWIHLESHLPTFMYPYLLIIDCLAHVVLYAQNIEIYKMFTVIYIYYSTQNSGG